MEITHATKQIIELGKFLFEYGYVVASDGNISIRLNKKEILITRSGVCKGELKIGDIVKIGTNNWKIKNTDYKIMPSSEYRMHLAIYANRPDINAVIHAHPPFATSFAVSGRKLNINLLTETEQLLGSIKYLGYYQPGSVKLAKAVSKAVIRHNVIILGKHGVVVGGKDLTEARYRLERLEFLAKVSWLVLLAQ
ncbi:MAG: class II aldolase/adducin family protein [candidate division WOR-3 bacterium]